MKSSGSFLCCAAFTGLLSVTILFAIGYSTSGRALAQAPQAAAPQNPQAAGPVVLPDAPGKDTAKRVCSGCHSADVWAKQRHTSQQWGVIVDRMVSRGAEGTDDEFSQILQYLSANLAPVTPPVDAHPGPAPPSKP